jgi:hypothetical protein
LSACSRRQNATYRHDTVAAFPDLLISATADHVSAVLTSHLPWSAIGGRTKPTSPQHEAVSAWERQQQQAEELDRKLIISRGC